MTVIDRVKSLLWPYPASTTDENSETVTEIHRGQWEYSDDGAIKVEIEYISYPINRQSNVRNLTHWRTYEFDDAHETMDVLDDEEKAVLDDGWKNHRIGDFD